MFFQAMPSTRKHHQSAALATGSNFNLHQRVHILQDPACIETEQMTKFSEVQFVHFSCVSTFQLNMQQQCLFLASLPQDFRQLHGGSLILPQLKQAIVHYAAVSEAASHR